MAEQHKTAIRVRVKDRFPSAHIEAFGAGTIGRLHTTRNAQGEIVMAEARLHNAPYQRLIIDDPNILRIFGVNGEDINMDALLHPWPRFRLDPIRGHAGDTNVAASRRSTLTPPTMITGVPDTADDDLDVEIARLVDVTNQPKSARLGLIENEKNTVHSSIKRSIDLAEEKRRKRGQTYQVLYLVVRIASTNMHLVRKTITVAPVRSSTRVISSTKMSSIHGDELKTHKDFASQPSERSSARLHALSALPITPQGMSRSEDVATTRVDSSSKTSRVSGDSGSAYVRVIPYTPVPLPRQKPHNLHGRNPSSTRSNIVPKGKMESRIRKLVGQIYATLPTDSARDQYAHFVSVVRKEAARNPLSKRKLHRELEEFVNEYGFGEAHNRYVIWSRAGSNQIYHLPTIEIRSTSALEEPDHSAKPEREPSQSSRTPLSEDRSQSDGSREVASSLSMTDEASDVSMKIQHVPKPIMVKGLEGPISTTVTDEDGRRDSTRKEVVHDILSS